MEKLNFRVIQSLENIALTKIAIVLWQKLSHLPKNSLEFKTWRFNKYHKIKDIVKKMTFCLPLPESLSSKVMHSYKTINNEVEIFILYHLKFMTNCSEVMYSTPLVWLTNGKIDRKSMVESFVRNERLKIHARFVLASVYCLENYIPSLLSEMSENTKDSLEDLHNHNFYVLEKFWVHKLNYKCKCLYCDNIIEEEVYSGNKIATEYFFQKLTAIEKREYVLYLTKHVAEQRYSETYPFMTPLEYYSEVLFYLLGQMSQEQLIELLEASPSHILSQILECFLDFPFQFFFMDVVNFAWTYFDKESYIHVLNAILCKAVHDNMDFDYQSLFIEFWNLSNPELKQYFVDSEERIVSLFNIKNDMYVKIITDYLPFEKKKNIGTKYKEKVSKSLMQNGNIQLFEFFIRKFIISRVDRVLCKTYIEETVKMHASGLLLEEFDSFILQTFLEMINKYIFEE